MGPTLCVCCWFVHLDTAEVAGRRTAEFTARGWSVCRTHLMPAVLAGDDFQKMIDLCREPITGSTALLTEWADQTLAEPTHDEKWSAIDAEFDEDPTTPEGKRRRILAECPDCPSGNYPGAASTVDGIPATRCAVHRGWGL